MAQQDPFDTSFGQQDPTALFQNLQQQNQSQGAMGQINTGAAAMGMNPQIQQAQQIQQKLKQIIGQTNEELDGDPANKDMDPIDRQSRIAQAVASGMVGINPQISMKANEQVLKLANAKAEQRNLQSETEEREVKTQGERSTLAQKALDPMVLVTMDKDELGIPTAKQYGNPLSIFDMKGQITPQGSQDYQDAMQSAQGKGVQVIPMRASQYAQMIEKMNEGRNLAMMARINQQTQMQMLSQQSPDALQAQAQRIIARDAPMPDPPTVRNPMAIQNYNGLIDAIKAQGTDPASIDKADFQNNMRQENAFNHGPQADVTRAINVAFTHAQLLRQYFDAQRNNNMPMDQKIPFLNAIKNKWDQLGGGPIPTTIDAAKDFVSDEWTKGILSMRPALADRIMAQDKVSRNASPAQFTGALDAWSDLGAGQLDGLRREYASGLHGRTEQQINQRWYGGTNQFGQVQEGHVSPEVHAWEQKTRGGTKATVPGSGTTETNPASISTQDAYNKLNKGDWFSWNGSKPHRKN